MRRLAPLLLITVAMLGGCATERRSAPMSWNLGESAGVSRLVLGVPDTDDVALIMTCRPRSGALDITFVGRPGDPAVVELRSGAVVGRYVGVGEADEESGGVDFQFKASVADPVFARFADTGTLAVVLPDRHLRLPNGFAAAHDFLARCRAP